MFVTEEMRSITVYFKPRTGRCHKVPSLAIQFYPTANIFWVGGKPGTLEK